MKIKNLCAREILDSRGYPTIEAEVTLQDETAALSQVPAGVSRGANEAVELRDNDPKRYFGQGVLKAVENINSQISRALIGRQAEDQAKIDQTLIDLDGTKDKSSLGANAILGVSMAVCRAAGRSQKIPLYKYLGSLLGLSKFVLPQPIILIMEGGEHGGWATDFQEYSLIPKREVFTTFRERLRAGAEIFSALREILKSQRCFAGVGLEGGFIPKGIKSNEEAFELMALAIQKAGYIIPKEVVLAVDFASSEFFLPAGRQGKDDKYTLKTENLILEPIKWTEKIISLTDKYSLWSLEDIYYEEDWDNWALLTARIGSNCQIVGDDLLITNPQRIKKAIEKKACNAVIIKPNQIGTITETLSAIRLAKSAGLTTIISHRGGETNDEFVADLAVASSSDCKFGAPNRGERIAKYNRLLKIEENLTF